MTTRDRCSLQGGQCSADHPVERLNEGALRKVYDPELKRAAVRAYLEEGMTRREVVKHYGIASLSTFKKWVIAYRREGEAALERQGYAAGGRHNRPTPTFDPLDPQKGVRMRQENQRLAGKLEV